VASFAASARLDVTLTANMDVCKTAIENMYPANSTAIGDGMLEAYESLKAANARPGAIKTLIVFSDGANKTGTDPEVAAAEILAENPDVVIHTVTFGVAAEITAMQAIAASTTGKHYHAADSDQLVEVFREIATSYRTLITE